MPTFLLICTLIFSLLALGCAVFSYLALKGSAESADLAGQRYTAASQAAERATDRSDAAHRAAAMANRHRADAELARDHASGHADDAALALAEMKPETVTVIDKQTGEPLFHYPEIERDCE